MTIVWRLYSCDDHLDLWNLPRDVFEDRLPARFRDRGPRVVETGDSAWWTCDGATMGPYGTRLMRDYSAITRAGIEDDGLRAARPALRLQDMDRDGVHASVIYGPNLFGLPIDDAELKAAALAAYNDWALEFNRHDPERLSVLPVLPTHAPEPAIAELHRTDGRECGELPAARRDAHLRRPASDVEAQRQAGFLGRVPEAFPLGIGAAELERADDDAAVARARDALQLRDRRSGRVRRQDRQHAQPFGVVSIELERPVVVRAERRRLQLRVVDREPEQVRPVDDRGVDAVPVNVLEPQGRARRA